MDEQRYSDEEEFEWLAVEVPGVDWMFAVAIMLRVKAMVAPLSIERAIREAGQPLPHERGRTHSLLVAASLALLVLSETFILSPLPDVRHPRRPIGTQLGEFPSAAVVQPFTVAGGKPCDETFVFPGDVTFQTGSADLSDNGVDCIRRVAGVARSRPSARWISRASPITRVPRTSTTTGWARTVRARLRPGSWLMGYWRTRSR